MIHINNSRYAMSTWDYLTLIDALFMIYACVTYRVVRRIVVVKGTWPLFFSTLNSSPARVNPHFSVSVDNLVLVAIMPLFADRFGTNCLMPCVFSASDGGVPLRDPVGQLLLCGQQTGHAQQGGLCLQWRTVIPACYRMQANAYTHTRACEHITQLYRYTSPCIHECMRIAAHTLLGTYLQRNAIYLCGVFFFLFYVSWYCRKSISVSNVQPNRKF